MTTLKPKVGDRVTVIVEGEVEKICPKELRIRRDDGWTNTILLDHITAIHPRPLKVGDAAIVPVSSPQCTKVKIIGIDGSTAWVKWPSGARGEFCLSDLEQTS